MSEEIQETDTEAEIETPKNEFAGLGLGEPVLNAITDAGYSTPTPIQAEAIPHVLAGKDVMGIAQTGTGKTASFTLPMIDRLAQGRAKARMPRSLILCPTRELAAQVAENFETYGKYHKLSMALLIGGVAFADQERKIDRGVDVLIATPGRLLDHVERGKLVLLGVQILVVDEADRMLDMGFSTVVNQIAAEARWRKQNLLFSATLEGKGVKTFAHDILNNPEVIEANPSRKEKNKIHQWYHLADDMNHKQALLVNILKQETTTSAVVFVKTRERLQMLKDFLASKDIPVCWLQGEMPQDKRIAALARFKSGEVPILLATDVAARGIDVPNVSHVINFDMPRKADVYVHRIGRTGRAGAKGTAISLVEAHDFDMVAKTARYMGEPLKARVIDELRPKNKTPKIGPKKKKVKAKDKAKAKGKPKKKK